jgi:hypothetical protein
MSSVSQYFAHKIMHTHDHWTFSVSRRDHYIVLKRTAPRAQRRGATSQKDKYLNFTARKACNVASIQMSFLLTITQAIIDVSKAASRGNLLFPELIEFEFRPRTSCTEGNISRHSPHEARQLRKYCYSTS